MNSVLVGMFDSRSAAEQARTRLIEAGFAPGSVTGSAGTDSTSPVAEPQDEGGISGFFRSIFGSDDAATAHSSTYQEAFRRGGFGLTVESVADADMDRVSDIMEDCGAVDVDEREQQWRNDGWSGASTSAATSQAAVGQNIASGETKTVNLVEENLAVGKRSVGRGGVRVFSRVVETPVEETIRLREEHAAVERRVVDRPATEADFAAFKEGAIEVRSTAEEAVVSKTARVVGEVQIGTQVTERDEVVRDTVRKTEVDVEQLDAGQTSGTGTTTNRAIDLSSTTNGGEHGSANRDPLTGTPGAHPVGTGVGALAGGAATGAAVGTVAGPVGTAIGAAVGAVAGGLAGKGIAEEVDPTVDPARKQPL